MKPPVSKSKIYSLYLIPLNTSCAEKIPSDPWHRVDSETENRMQDIIRTEFRTSTVVAIAHRLEGLLDYNRIVWLDKGRIVEVDTPQALMGRDSHFRRMLDRSNEGKHESTSNDDDNDDDDGDNNLVESGRE
jgi:ABC-type multidrug transport system ATPase subunit